MRGPYDYVPPSYWLTDTKNGGAFGFATEIGPGAAVPPLESLQKMLPTEHLWPIDDVWSFHAGGDEFKDLKLFTEALDARYGKADRRRGLRAQGAGAGLRGPARDVRGLRAQQVHARPASSSGCSTTPGRR